MKATVPFVKICRLVWRQRNKHKIAAWYLIVIEGFTSNADTQTSGCVFSGCSKDWECDCE